MPESTEDLLRAWFQWWTATDGPIPAKMPDSLHTRTAVHLAELDQTKTNIG